MPQIDVYIFRFFPCFVFFVFLLVYLYVYYIMIPNISGVLKFRIKYLLNLNQDLVRLKRAELQGQFFLANFYNFCLSVTRKVNTNLRSIYIHEGTSKSSLKIVKL